MNGGTTHELSPEWMPASSMCSMMPPMTTAPVASATASTSNSKASSRNLSISTGCSCETSTALRHVAIERRRRRRRSPCRGRRARTTAGRRPGSRSSRPPRAPPRARWRCRSPAAGCSRSRQQRREALAILGQVDRIGRRAENRARPPPAAPAPASAASARRTARGTRPRRRPPRSVSMHRHHVLERQRLEVQPIGGVVVGRDRLRVAVDHHRLEAFLAEREGGVTAAVVELDALADPVRARCRG